MNPLPAKALLAARPRVYARHRRLYVLIATSPTPASLAELKLCVSPGKYVQLSIQRPGRPRAYSWNAGFENLPQQKLGAHPEEPAREDARRLASALCLRHRDQLAPLCVPKLQRALSDVRSSLQTWEQARANLASRAPFLTSQGELYRDAIRIRENFLVAWQLSGASRDLALRLAPTWHDPRNFAAAVRAALEDPAMLPSSLQLPSLADVPVSPAAL